jgi:DNA-binding SARP family transcriptional activator
MATIRADKETRRRGPEPGRDLERRLERLRLIAALATRPLMTTYEGREPGGEPATQAQATPAVRPAPKAPAATGVGVAPLRLLGAPQLAIDGGGPIMLERRTAALLALLVLQGPTPRARAAALVWPEVDDVRASNSLRQRIYKLRQAAGRDVIVSDRHIALAADVAHDLAAPLAHLAENPEACRGELLGELDFSDCHELADWVSLARQRWRAELAHALAELASRWEGEGRIAGALRLAERLVELEPTAEHGHRRVMRLHYLRGDRAAALNAFDRCRSVLRSELGVLPDAETQQLQQLIESGAAAAPARAAPPQPVQVLRPPRLVGREAEWLRLERAMAERRTLLVMGEAGVGKSRLLADFAAAHDGIVVSARPGDASVPYASLARLLRALLGAGIVPGPAARPELARLLPELGAAPQGPFNPLRLRAAAQEVVQRPDLPLPDFSRATAHAPAMLALDDAHFADAATLEMLPMLTPAPTPGAAAAAAAAPGMHWVVASRPRELPAALDVWRNAGDADTLKVLTLQPLDEAGVQELLSSLALPGLDAARWAPALHRHTGGNPMFVLETLRALLQGGKGTFAAGVPAALPLPDDVGGLIERRLAQLSPEALDLARVAALAGQDFTPELAARVLERRVIDLAAPWAELESAQVIREQAFAHDLVLEATRGTVPKPVAAALHRRLAQLLKSAGSSPAQLAHHWRLAGAPLRAAQQFLTAAAHAQSRGHKQLEWSLFDEAATSFEQGGSLAGCFRALRAGLDACVAVRPAAEGEALVSRLRTLASDDTEKADALFAVQYLEFVRGNNARSAEVGATVVEQARACGARAVEFQALRHLGSAFARLGRSHAGIEVFERARAMLGEVGSVQDEAQLLAEMANCIETAGQRTRSVHMRTLVLAKSAALVNWSDRMNCLNSQAAALNVLGQPAQALVMADEAFAMADHISDGHALHVGFNRATAGTIALAAGEFTRSIAALEQSLACFTQAGLPIQHLTAQMLLAAAWVTLGQAARAQQLLAVDVLSAGPRTQARKALLLARLARVLGRDASVHSAAADTWVRTEREYAPVHYMVELEAARDDAPADALVRCRELESRARREEALGMALQARVRQVDCLRRLDAAAGARLALEVVAEAGALSPGDMYVPELWWVCHLAFEAAGEAAPAHAALARALAWISDHALPRTPPPFRHSFLQRNPVNRDVLAAAAREGLAPPRAQ